MTVARPHSAADVSPFPSESAAAAAAALSKEVEEEANSNFQRIYNHPPHPTLSIEEVLDMLKRFQDSSVQHERVSGGGGGIFHWNIGMYGRLELGFIETVTVWR